MSKLYKLIAYHCPTCGGSTKPGKRFCDWCERRLQEYIGERCPRIRLLVHCANDYVYWNELLSIEEYSDEPETIDCTTLYAPSYVGYKNSIPTLNMELPMTERGIELSKLIVPNKPYKMQIEVNGLTMAYEIESSLKLDKLQTFNQNEMLIQHVELDKIVNFEMTKNLIPQKVVDELHCPNCGAPVRSRFGACDYCGGWLSVEW